MASEICRVVGISIWGCKLTSGVSVTVGVLGHGVGVLAVSTGVYIKVEKRDHIKVSC